MKKRKMRKSIIILFVLLIAIVAYPTFLILQLTSKDYTFSTSIKTIKHDLREQVLAKNYSKTLETAINDNNFNIKYVNNYFEIDYKEQKNFIKNINELIKKEYLSSDINIINTKLTEDEISSLISKDYIKDLVKYLEFDFFKFENLDRYLKYETENYKDKIVYVNIGLDKEYYKDAKTITEFNINVIANKYNKLDEKFEPNDIQKIKSTCSIGTEYLSITAKEAFEKMCDDAANEKKFILANSAYRSYKDQQGVYDTYLKLYGKTYVSNYVANPGFSEHQTGLAVDVAAKG